MKRCPTCRRRYSDDSLNFCLDDGSSLFAEPDSEPTLISPTVAAPLTPARITSSPSQAPKSSNRWALLAVIILLAVMLGGGAVALLYRITKWDSPNDERTSRTSPATPETKASESAPARPNSPGPTPASARVPNLSGEWSLVNTIEATSYPLYANLRLGYHLTISQTGTEFTADGEKLSENGRSMDDSERTPIHVTGSVDQDSVTATFVEEGIRRKSSGRFVWTITADGNHLRGTFVSTAAKSSGSSVATRER
jgi:cytoskeletal protein RodZ